MFPTRTEPERALLLGVERKGGRSLWRLEESLEELAQLARTAGAQVVGVVAQRLDSWSPFYIGRGKVEEVKALVAQRRANLVLCDDEITPSQQKNLENALGVKVLDRSALILDIFAQHARTREGRLQVELAQHRYLLPRLVHRWPHLERPGGGIGTRGPGETQLETDRRLIRRRIQRLEEALEEVRRHRSLYRSRRRANEVPVVSLVGYTNAGKSTLFNALTRAGVPAEARLFSTLDPTTRRVRLPGGRTVLLTDTVGFIRKLPPTVVAAFQATLEELEEADLLLHVVDISHPQASLQAQVVEETLERLGLGEKPHLLVLNKADLMMAQGDPAGNGGRVVQDGLSGVLVSAVEGWGLEALLGEIDRALEDQEVQPQASTTYFVG